MANAGPFQTVDTGASVQLDGSASSDPDGDTLSYLWEQTYGPAVSLSSATAQKPTFTAPPSATVVGFKLTVSDGTLSAVNWTAITVSNRAPVANAGPDQTVNTGASVTLDGSASSDPDSGDILNYRWEQTSGPTVSLSSALAQKPTFTAPASAASLTFTLWVDDGALGESDSVTITVPNRAPVANAGPDLIARAGASVTLDGSASSDPDSGDTLSYLWEQTAGPTVSLSSVTAQKPTFTTPADASTLSFRLTVSDGTLTNSDSVTITVQLNLAPVANAGPDQTVPTNASVQLDGSASSDPDGDTLGYLWEQTAGPTVSLSSATAQKPTFTAPASATSLTFRLTVNDGTLTNADSVTITVKSPVLAFSATSYSAAESAGSAMVTVTRTGYFANAASVRFQTANGTATAGSDYTAVNQIVSFAANQTAKNVSVPVLQDAVEEGTETVSLRLSSPSSGATLGSPNTATLRILNVTLPPRLVSAPTLAGTARDTQTLSTDGGTWSSGVTYSRAYAWERCNADGGSCQTIGGASSSSYAVTPVDIGRSLRAKVTATNSGGSTVAYSSYSAAVAAAIRPTGTPPTIYQSGSTLWSDGGWWSGDPASNTSYYWQWGGYAGSYYGHPYCYPYPSAGNWYYASNTPTFDKWAGMSCFVLMVTKENSGGATTVTSGVFMSS